MKCYVCGGECSKEVVHGQYTYWKCSDCFTSQVLPQPSATELQEYYDSFHLSDAAGGVYDEVEDRMKADFPAMVRMVLKYAKVASPRLLDVGCGKGFFVRAAMDGGIRAEGIDVSHSGVAYAAETLGVKATVGRIEKQDSCEWKESFDVATSWATIEHLDDPMVVLRAIHSSLKPGGMFLCDTALGNVFWERFLPGHNQWYDAPQHLFVFSKKGLVRMIESCGFSIIHVDVNFERSMVRKIVRWIRHVALCVGGGIFPGILLGARAVSKMRQQAKWPIGLAIFVVAQKIDDRT